MNETKFIIKMFLIITALNIPENSLSIIKETLCMYYNDNYLLYHYYRIVIVFCIVFVF